MVRIQWPPAGMEQATPEWRQRASEAMAFRLGSWNDERYSDWDSALKQRPECRLDLPDTTTRRGLWTASGSCQPDAMNEILRDIPQIRRVLLITGLARGSPRLDEMFPETGE